MAVLRISNILVVVCFVCAILCLLLVSCTDITQSPAPPSGALGTTEHKIAAANNEFALRFLRHLINNEPRKNTFASPFSYMQALTMTLNGAGGATRDSMVQTLSLGSIAESDANAGLRNLRTYFETLDTNVEFRTANGIWYNTRLTPEQDFITKVNTAYGAEVRGMNFGRDAVKDDINRWVEQKTNNRIKNLIQEEFTREDLMCLVNAVYYNAKWQYPFDPNATSEGVFFQENGSQRRVPFMNGRTQQLRHTSLGNNAEVVEIPYGNGAFVMTVVLPAQGSTLAGVLAGITPASWNDALSRLSSSATIVIMPKFSLETRYEERKRTPRELHQMGMGIAFSDYSDFTRMYRPPTEAAISFVIHQTFLQVDERGTEAAAATAVGVIERTSVGTPPFVARLDRPFAFFLRERSSGAILFAGTLYEP